MQIFILLRLTHIMDMDLVVPVISSSLKIFSFLDFVNNLVVIMSGNLTEYIKFTLM